MKDYNPKWNLSVQGKVVRDTIQNTEFGLLDTLGEKKIMKFINIVHRCEIMTTFESLSIKLLPKKVSVFRGISSDEKIDFKKFGLGVNWSLKKDIAEWFAKCRGGKYKAFIEAEVSRDDIICQWLDKKEAEVIINPNDIILNNLIIKKWKEVK